MMTPPRLTLVSRNDDIEDSRRDEPEAAEAVELARALSEAEPQAAPELVTQTAERREKLRILEALLFAASEPLDEERLASHIGPGEAISTLMAELQ
jgi:segregation and condensation protein B